MSNVYGFRQQLNTGKRGEAFIDSYFLVNVKSLTVTVASAVKLTLIGRAYFIGPYTTKNALGEQSCYGRFLLNQYPLSHASKNAIVSQRLFFGDVLLILLFWASNASSVNICVYTGVITTPHNGQNLAVVGLGYRT